MRAAVLQSLISGRKHWQWLQAPTQLQLRAQAALLGSFICGCQTRLPGHDSIQARHDCQRFRQRSKGVLGVLAYRPWCVSHICRGHQPRCTYCSCRRHQRLQPAAATCLRSTNTDTGTTRL